MIKRTSFYLSIIISSICCLATSCVNIDNSLGDNLIPEYNNLVVGEISKLDITLPIGMKVSDSLQTNSNLKTYILTHQSAEVIAGTDFLVLGSFADPDLGNSRSDGIIQLLPKSDHFKATFGEDPEPVSVYLHLPTYKYVTFNDKDKTIPQNIQVYKLNKTLDSSLIYSNSISEDNIEKEPISDGNNLYLGEGDIKIKLTANFAKQLLSVKPEEMDSINFLKIFKGFVIRTDPQSSAVGSGRYNMVSPYKSYIELIYRHKDSSKKIDKDSSLIYSFGYNSKNFWLNKYTHSSQHLATDEPSKYVYLEGLAGIKPYIDFEKVRSDLYNWCKSKNLDPKRVIVLNAKVIMPFDAPEDYETYNQFPSTITIGAKVSHVKNVFILDNIGNVSLNTEQNGGDGKLNRSLNNYTIDISDYIQKVLNGKLPSDHLKPYIMSLQATIDEKSHKTTSLTLDNRQYCKVRLNGQAHKNCPTLNITYAIRKD